MVFSLEHMGERVDIAMTNPLTREITASNAGSPLLRLPQELKDQIYRLVLGGQLIHTHDYSDDHMDGKVLHQLCQAQISERKAHEIFAASKGPWSPAGGRHDLCYDATTNSQHCRHFTNDSNHANDPCLMLTLALISCCRQVYQEARSIPFSANTWSFICPWSLQSLCIRDKHSDLLCQKTIFFRRLHLDILVSDQTDEEFWNKAFNRIARNLKSLQYLYIDIDQQPYAEHVLKEWRFKSPTKSTFLSGLLKLRDLRLRFATVTISDYSFLQLSKIDLTNEVDRNYRWTIRQKQEWAAYVMRVLLRQEGQEDARSNES